MRSVSNDLKLGVTAGSYLGLGVKFDDSWAGRYYVQQEDFTTSFLNGAVGYKVNDWLSVGGGLSLVYGQLGVQTNINNVLDGGAGWAAEIQGHRHGCRLERRVCYRAPRGYAHRTDLHVQGGPQVQGHTSIHGAGPILSGLLQTAGFQNAQSTFDFTLPNQVMLSVYHDLTPDLAIMADLGWQNWSKFGQIGVVVDTTDDRTTFRTALRSTPTSRIPGIPRWGCVTG